MSGAAFLKNGSSHGRCAEDRMQVSTRGRSAPSCAMNAFTATWGRLWVGKEAPFSTSSTIGEALTSSTLRPVASVRCGPGFPGWRPATGHR